MGRPGPLGDSPGDYVDFVEPGRVLTPLPGWGESQGLRLDMPLKGQLNRFVLQGRKSKIIIQIGKNRVPAHPEQLGGKVGQK